MAIIGAEIGCAVGLGQSSGGPLQAIVESWEGARGGDGKEGNHSSLLDLGQDDGIDFGAKKEKE